MLSFESMVRQGGDFEKVFEATGEFRAARREIVGCHTITVRELSGAFRHSIHFDCLSESDSYAGETVA